MTGLYDAFKRGDLERARTSLDSDVVWVEHFPFPGTFHGPEAVCRVFQKVAETFDMYEMTFEHLFSEDARVVSIGQYTVRRRDNPDVFRSRFAHLYQTRAGLITHYEGLLNTTAARDTFGELRWDEEMA